MNGNRHRLRLLYWLLCAAQLVVTGMGLALAYQVQRSYSQKIDYERAVNSEHRAVDELEIYARAASPQTLDLDDDSSDPWQVSQIAYASGIFLKKAQGLLEESKQTPGSPLARSSSDLGELITQMTMVARQSQMAREALAAHDSALTRARLTYADRSAERVHTILGGINQQMSTAKDDVLASERAEALRAGLFLRPLSIIGILLLLPALLYARRLDNKLWTYETRLESERNLLEERVASRTSELREEIQYRARMESFNGSRNRLLEKVASGKELDDVLTELVHATEQSLQDSRCLILLSAGHRRSAIAPTVSSELAAHLESTLLGKFDAAFWQDAAEQGALFIRGIDAGAGVAFANVWSHGFHILLAVPIIEQQQSVVGVLALLLRDQREPNAFARQVLLSASRVASVALEHDRMQDELFHRAHYDPLTELPNRVLFEDRLQHAVAMATRRQSQVGVLCIDLDGFKQVNDSHGHQTGDALLQQVAERLSSFARKTDTVARLGGDEFAAVVHDTHDGEGVAKLCQSLVGLLSEPYCVGDLILRTTASIGAALFPGDGAVCSELRRHADLAMYRAKERGRNTYQMFSAEIGDRLERRKRIEGYLQEALDHGGFELYYQPIYTMPRTLAGLEALIRFKNPELRSISPAEFIPVAEQAGQIPRIGEWVLREACRQAKQWQQDGLSPVPVAVNVSAIQLARPNFAESVAEILAESGLDPRWLHIEVTETAIMGDFEAGGRELYALAERGVQIAIDDFGTGHSSLSYIHRLPVKAVKIDRSFVRDMAESQESKAIVRAIIAMAQSLELTTIAEGVETQEQLTALAKAGCSVAQGYFFSRPLDRLSVARLIGRKPVAAPEAIYSIEV